ncbi:MAG: DUF6456 domain-containing protein, partial [Pannonibacter indicus]
MSRALTEEGRKVLKFLAATGAVIVSGSGQEDAPVRLEGRQETGGKRRQMIATVRVLHELKHLGLTREAPDGALRLSTEGRLHVRRMLSGGRDGFQLQHQIREAQTLQAGADGPIRVTVNLAESPLAWLARRKDGKGKAMLTAAQFEAGERLREDYTFAAMMPNLSGGWRTEAGGGRNTGRGPAGLDMSDNVMAARLRVERALDAVGRGLGGVLVDVCCLLKGLETVERERGWPVRSAKVVLG